MADKNLNNKEYWSKRAEKRVSNHWSNLVNVEKALAKNYRLANEDIKLQLANLYSEYAVQNNLSYVDSIKQLTQVEMSVYRSQIQQAILNANGNEELIERLKRLLPPLQVTRLQATINQIEARLIDLGYTEQITIEDWLAETYQGNYYQSIYDVQHGIGIGLSFTKLNERAIKTAITYPWSGDSFSNRVWDNKSKLVKTLRQVITQGLIRGESYQKMAKNMRDKMDASYKDSLRLIRTETSAVVGDSTAKGYVESGIVSRYIIISTLDNRTSTICQELDSKVFNLKDREVGVNASPMHPNCRSTEAPYFNDGEDLIGTRIVRGEDGKNYKVPRSMNYKQWKEKYVDGKTA
ncbi:MAG: minor capsid protein [Carnobacterium sp.]|uniref:minor capsid protein n=1 Tax=Carnobacterium sp. TaxID=48221 RepID=UPI003C7588E1